MRISITKDQTNDLWNLIPHKKHSRKGVSIEIKTTHPFGQQKGQAENLSGLFVVEKSFF